MSKLVILILVAPLGLLNCASAHPNSGNRTEVQGRIVDPPGNGVSGLGVLFTVDEGRGVRRTAASATTDRKGEFRLQASPGRYTVILDANDLHVPSVFLDSVEVRRSPMVWNYHYDGFKVVGRWIGPDHQPIRSGRVEIMGSEDETHRGVDLAARLHNGAFVFYLHRGEYYFRLRPSQQDFPDVDQTAPVRVESDATLELHLAAFKIEGRVELEGRPLRDAEINVTGHSGEDQVRAALAKDRNGEYRVFLPPGPYSFCVVPRPRDRHVVLRFLNHEIDGSRHLDLDMSGVWWTGVVRDQRTLRALRSVQVRATDVWWDSVYAECTTDRSGRFKLGVEVSHRYKLSVRSDAITLCQRDGSPVAAGKDSTFELMVEP